MTKTMKQKIDALHAVYGTWREVARVMHKSIRQVRNLRNGFSGSTHELHFYIDHVLADLRPTKK